ncbi:hypothetical protein J3E72DRAFT_274348, partial [Bipolaris maydis]|uniref:uncharacterized protein n=1 Tax=Cochliobolus heterostrophus TaxID=5016 RepID=UPI0024DC73D4
MSIFAGLLLYSLVSFLRPYLLRKYEMRRDKSSPVPAMTSFFVSINSRHGRMHNISGWRSNGRGMYPLRGETVRTGCSLCHNTLPRQSLHHTKKFPFLKICFVIMDLGPCEDREEREREKKKS